MPKSIALTKGKFAVVDDDMFDILNRHNWFFTNGYAARQGKRQGRRRVLVFMHVVIANPPAEHQVDHVNGDTLDNTRINLRICSHAQNVRNRAPIRKASSQYKGVSWYKRDNRWLAKIAGRHLGYFDSEVDAAKAYDAAALEQYGDFAWLNFPPEHRSQLDKQKYIESTSCEPNYAPSRPIAVHQAELVPVICCTCGKTTEKSRYYASRYDKNYCDRACWRNRFRVSTPGEI